MDGAHFRHPSGLESADLGGDLLVAPCLRPDGAVSVYLPAGDWVRFPGGEALAGGRVHHLQLALDEIAAFARRGARIPLGGPAAPIRSAIATVEHWQA